MSFLKSLFGFGKSAPPAPAAPAPMMEHKGYTISATPMVVGHEFQVCGLIAREIDGALKEKTFIRVDRMASKDDAIDLIFRKGRQIIDQSGDKLFD